MSEWVIELTGGYAVVGIILMGYGIVSLVSDIFGR